MQTSDVGVLVEQVDGCTVGFNGVSFNAVGIDLVASEGCTLTRNNVTRSAVVGCRWDGSGTHTFTANACASEIPPGAWD